MNNQRQGIDRIAVDQNIQPHQVAAPVVEVFVVEGGITARQGFEAVIEIEDDLVERQLVSYNFV